MSHDHGHAPTLVTRSQRYAEVADALGKTCCASINNDGSQACDDSEGKLWNGTIFYCAGEMARVRDADIRNLNGKNFIQILANQLRNCSDENTLERGFFSIGMSMLGSADNNLILHELEDSEQQKSKLFLQVNEAYDNNWEVFNANICIGR
ncbi:MAG: hypothetical protein HRU15_15920, partial [Planctomycetes bacterium]|nr:hypothetical protein [Planctomycetota bacterium]